MAGPIPDQDNPFAVFKLVRIAVVRHRFPHTSSYVGAVSSDGFGNVSGGGTQYSKWYNQGFLIKVTNVSNLNLKAQFEYEIFKDVHTKTLEDRRTISTNYLRPGQSYEIPLEVYDVDKAAKHTTLTVSHAAVLASGTGQLEAASVDWKLYALTQPPRLVPGWFAKTLQWGSFLAIIAGIIIAIQALKPEPSPDACGPHHFISNCKTVDAVYEVIHRDMMEIGSIRTFLNGGIPSWIASRDDISTRGDGSRWTAYKAYVLEARARMVDGTLDTRQKRELIFGLKQAFVRYYDKYNSEENKARRYEALGKDQSLFNQTIGSGGPIEFGWLRQKL